MKSEREALGPAGNCVCLACGATKPHVPGVPCMQERCPSCGKAMMREGSTHHLASVANQEKAKQGK